MTDIQITSDRVDFTQFFDAATVDNDAVDPALVQKTFGTVMDRPTGLINIDVSTLCNLKCRMCPIWGDIKRGVVKRQVIDFDVFRTVMDRVREHATPFCVSLVARGELFCHSRAMDICRHIRSMGYPLSIITNATLMTPDHIRELLSMQQVNIRVSIDALLPETYKDIRTKDLLMTVAGNVHLMARLLRGEMPSPGSSLGVHFVLQDRNEPELFPFVLQWGPYVDMIRANKWNTQEDSTLSKRRINENFIVPRRHPCTAPWLDIFVDSDAHVYPCCSDSFLTMNLGDLKTQSLREIWLGEPYQKLRAAHLSGDLSEFPTCAACDNWNLSSKKKPLLIQNHLFSMTETVNSYDFVFNRRLPEQNFDPETYLRNARELMEKNTGE